jgi:hypothetical protein
MLDMKSATGRLIRSFSLRDRDAVNQTREQRKLTKRRPLTYLDTTGKLDRLDTCNELPALQGGGSERNDQEGQATPSTVNSEENGHGLDEPQTPDAGTTQRFDSLQDENIDMNVIKGSQDIPRGLLSSSHYEGYSVTDIPFFCPICPPRLLTSGHAYSPSLSDSTSSKEHKFESEEDQPATNQYSWTSLGAEETLEVAPSIFSAHSSSPSLTGLLQLPQLLQKPFRSSTASANNSNNYPGFWYTPLSTRLLRASSDPPPIPSHYVQHFQQAVQARRHSEAQKVDLGAARRKSSLRETLRRRASSAASDVAVQARGLGRRVIEGIARGFMRKGERGGEERPVRVVIRRRRGGVRWVIESEDDGVGGVGSVGIVDVSE